MGIVFVGVRFSRNLFLLSCSTIIGVSISSLEPWWIG